MKDLYVIDATGTVFRSYFAIERMSNTRGQSTNALYGFVRSVLKVINDFTPQHIVAVFDAPDNKASRTAIYPEYKANRTEIPADLPRQIEWAKEFCKLAGIPTLMVSGVEADDTMGSVARWATQKNSEVFLCTADKDMYQLVDSRTKMLQTHKENLIIDESVGKEIYGVAPGQMIDLLAMAGDSSDNIPGLPGFGPKTAAKLLDEVGDLDTILQNPDCIKGKKRDTLREHGHLAELSRTLVTIDTNVKIPHDPEFYTLRATQDSDLAQFYRDKNFLSLLGKEMTQNSKKTEKLDYHLVDTEENLSALQKRLSSFEEICFDTETTSLEPLKAKLVGVGFAVKEAEAYYLPLNGKLGYERALSALRQIFMHSGKRFYGHNSKYDLHVLANSGIVLPQLGRDTLLASYLLNAHSHRHSLDALCLQYFNKHKTPIEDLIGKGKKQISMWEVPLELVCTYCCEDVDYTLRLRKKLDQNLRDSPLKSLLDTVEMPLLRVLFQMERRGIFLERAQLNDFAEELKEQIAALEEKIFKLACTAFNLRSPKQLSEVLYDNLGIKAPKKGRSTSAAVLESLRSEHAIIDHILEYRGLEKLRSTYAEALPSTIDEATGRVHCTFNQSVAATGRLSSQNPNLQNIPVRSENGRRIRQAFRPEQEGWSYLSADYSQIELRLLAHMSGDPTLLKAFREGQDIHSFTASKVLSIPLSEVTKEQRAQAKAVNFGIIYGQGSYGLARELGIKPAQAKDFIEKYFARYPTIKDFISLCIRDAQESGKTRTLTGRERQIPEIHSSNAALKAAAERLAVNTPLQGTAADIIKMAMLEVDGALKTRGMRSFMVLQIHDELILECPDGELEEVRPLVKAAMENVLELKVALTVDISIGKNWREC